IALSGDGSLVFVGRSLESLFDYASGLLLETTWATRPVLLNVSLRGAAALGPRARQAASAHLAEAGLAPASIAARERPVVLVDVVASGGTFGSFATLLLELAEASGVDTNAVRRRLRFVGLTSRKRTSPKTWRWQQHAEWTRGFRPSAIKNVSV